MDKKNRTHALVLFALSFSSVVFFKLALPVFEIDPKHVEKINLIIDVIDVILTTTVVISLVDLVGVILFMLLNLIFRR